MAVKYDVLEVLKSSIEKNASDIFIIAGSPYAFKINHVIEKQCDEKLTPADTEDLISQIYEIHGTGSIEEFKRIGDDDFSFSLPGIGRFRVNAYRQRGSLAAVLRVVRFEIPDPEKLHIPEEVLELCNITRGMVLFTGAAGSGKSTSLACMIDKINSERNCHIITLEDPIEYLHNHKKSLVSQREIYHDSKDYLSALRAALRETPEVILLGEMRDPETISAALMAAETGHLILSTLHTSTAVSTIDRIIDSFDSNQHQIRLQLSEVLYAVVSEQLVPSLEGEMIPVFEIMKVNTAIRSQIRESRLHLIENTMASCKDEGMITMDDALMNLYHNNKISKETLVDYAVHKENVMNRLMRDEGR